MPYELSFAKKVEIQDPGLYINPCCIGGNIVVDRLLPPLKVRYSDFWTDQEDWGWFIWFRKGPVRLAVAVFCDDPGMGRYRMHLSSTVRRWLFWNRPVDLPELDELRDLVERELTPWLGAPPRVERFGHKS